jgi:hypothetical protein
MKPQNDTLTVALKRIRDQLRYNTLCAPEYPDEDCTDLDREAREILSAIATLQTLSESEARRLMADAAARDAQSAFEHYVRGQPTKGRKLLESTLESLAYYEADRLPEARFIVAVDGTTKQVRNPHH